MISRKRLEEQLKGINFHYKGWGRTEVDELCNILMPDEEIEECVNGWYEAGFALLVSTKDRVLLVDKKPLGYLTVEDLRFDMINELDLHHRLMGAQIRISAGSKTLLFTSLNQVRLRRLLNYTQSRITQIKKDASEHQTAQKQHLEEMNEQLRLYLMAAHKQQYVEQAKAISEGHEYGQASSPWQQFQPYPTSYNPMAMPSAPAMHEQPPQPQPATPFEQAAMAAFEQRQASEHYAPTSIENRQPETDQQQPEPEKPAVHSEDAQRPRAHILTAVPRYSQAALQQSAQIILTPQQIGLAAARRVVPIISAYTRLPLMSQRRRYRPSQHAASAQ